MFAVGKVKHFLKSQKDFDDSFKRVAAYYRAPALLFRLDSLFSRLAFGSPVSQYIGFEFYRRNWLDRSTFITDGRIRGIMKTMNSATKEEHDELDEKQHFNKLYSEFIKREWLFAPDASSEELRSILQRHETLIVKPCNLSQGAGVYKLNCAEALAGFREFEKDAIANRLMLEEVIV